jgi:hypothetical protein
VLSKRDSTAALLLLYCCLTADVLLLYCCITHIAGMAFERFGRGSRAS